MYDYPLAFKNPWIIFTDEIDVSKAMENLRLSLDNMASEIHLF